MTIVDNMYLENTEALTIIITSAKMLISSAANLENSTIHINPNSTVITVIDDDGELM